MNGPESGGRRHMCKGEVCFGEGDGEGVKRDAEGIGVCTEHITT